MRSARWQQMAGEMRGTAHPDIGQKCNIMKRGHHPCSLTAFVKLMNCERGIFPQEDHSVATVDNEAWLRHLPGLTGQVYQS